MRILVIAVAALIFCSPVEAKFDAGVLHSEVEKVAPIDSISVGNPDDKQTWTITFKPEATAKQRSDAQLVLDGFDKTAFEQKETADHQLKQEATTALKTFADDSGTSAEKFQALEAKFKRAQYATGQKKTDLLTDVKDGKEN